MDERFPYNFDYHASDFNVGDYFTFGGPYQLEGVCMMLEKTDKIIRFEYVVSGEIKEAPLNLGWLCNQGYPKLVKKAFAEKKRRVKSR